MGVGALKYFFCNTKWIFLYNLSIILTKTPFRPLARPPTVDLQMINKPSNALQVKANSIFERHRSLQKTQPLLSISTQHTAIMGTTMLAYRPKN